MKHIAILLLIMPFFMQGQPDPERVSEEVDSLLKVSRNHLDNRDFEEAKRVNDRANELAIQSLGSTSSVYGAVVFNRGRILEAMGQYPEAEVAFKTGLRIQEKALPVREANFSRELFSLGYFYYSLGRWEEVEPNLTRALEIQRRVLGPEHPDYAKTLHILADYYTLSGQNTTGEKYYLEALEAVRRNYGDQCPEYADILIDLAIIYRNTGKYQTALPLFYQVRDIFEKAYGKSSTQYAGALQEMGWLYAWMKQLDKAEPLIDEAVRITEKIYGRQSREVAWALERQGLIRRFKKHYREAEKILLEVLEIRKELLGEHHNDYAVSLRGLAVLYSQMKDHQHTAAYYAEATRFNLEHLQKAVKFLREAEIKNYMGIFILTYHRLLTYLNDNRLQVPNLPASAFDYTLSLKGFLMEASKKLNIPRGLLSDSVQHTYDQWQAAQRQLTDEYALQTDRRQNLEALEAKAHALEKELIRSVNGFGEALQQVKWEEVSAALHSGEAAIEFVHFDYSAPDPKDSILYGALVLRFGAPSPLFIPLFEEKKLQALLKEQYPDKISYLNQLYGKNTSSKSSPNSLFQLIWQPIDSLLKDTKTIYCSPSGLLHRINLGAIQLDADQTIADRYHLVLLGSTRRLAIKDTLQAGINLSATLFGGILYDMDSTAIAKMVRDNAMDPRTYQYEFSFPYQDRAVPERSRSWTYLEGTEEEANVIAKLISDHQGNASLQTGYAATEEAFKKTGRGASSPKIIHIATHGYFYPEPKRDISNALAFRVSDQPMIRSGLIMAGANHVWRGNPPVEGLEDGILTAYEISQMNLQHTELVVLSACETGLGDIEGNEGVYGLQRAFKIAGVKNIIMSLWSVPDQQTQEMMVLFYDNWLNKNMDLRDAFHSAQKEMRKNYPEPYYWAGFILIE